VEEKVMRAHELCFSSDHPSSSVEYILKERMRINSSRSPRKRPEIELRDNTVGDHPGRVYVDVNVTAHVRNEHLEDEQIAYALALYDRAKRKLTLADVNVDPPWRRKGICSKVVERLFRLGGERYHPRSFAIDVRPGSDTGPRACACYLKAIHRAWEDHVTQMRIEYKSGEKVTVGDTRAEAALCQPGNLTIEGTLSWENLNALP